MPFYILFLVFASLKDYDPEGKPEDFFYAMKQGKRCFEISEILENDIQRYVKLNKKE
jgi:hypothetical protein